MNTQPYAGPPANVSPADLWSRLTQLPRPHRDFTFPHRGSSVTVRLVVLTESELMLCRAKSDEYAKRILKERQSAGEANLGYQDIYRNESVVQVVTMACRDPNGQSIKSFAFPNADMARDQFTSDEWALLFNAYCDHQVERGPLLSSMTTEEMEAWIEKLQEGGSRLPLVSASSELLRELVWHLVSTRSRSPMASGSAGSPPDEASKSPG